MTCTFSSSQPHEGGWLAALDEWGHTHLSVRWHQALFGWACAARERAACRRGGL